MIKCYHCFGLEQPIFDEDLSNNTLDNTVNWMLEDDAGNQWFSEITIDRLNEQVILDRGISVSVGQVPDAGTDPTNIADNGFLGASIEYADGAEAWYTGIPVMFCQRRRKK